MNCNDVADDAKNDDRGSIGRFWVIRIVRGARWKTKPAEIKGKWEKKEEEEQTKTDYSELTFLRWQAYQSGDHGS